MVDITDAANHETQLYLRRHGTGYASNLPLDAQRGLHLRRHEQPAVQNGPQGADHQLWLRRGLPPDQQNLSGLHGGQLHLRPGEPLDAGHRPPGTYWLYLRQPGATDGHGNAVFVLERHAHQQLRLRCGLKPHFILKFPISNHQLQLRFPEPSNQPCRPQHRNLWFRLRRT